MIHEILPVGALQCNCSIFGDETSREAIVIDPGDELSAIQQVLDRHQLTVKAIVITHAHIDHIGGAAKLKAMTGAPVYMNENDQQLYDHLDVQAAWLGVKEPERTSIDVSLKDGDTLQLGEATFHVFHTPGHTQGSVCLFYPPRKNWLRATRSFANPSAAPTCPAAIIGILRSIETKLMPLAEDTVVVPGHGANTTIGHEKDFNPFL